MQTTVETKPPQSGDKLAPQTPNAAKGPGDEPAQPTGGSNKGSSAQACVRCKAQKKGSVACRSGGRRGGGHSMHEYPPTSLTQPMCIELLNIRGTTFPQDGLLADQQVLEDALSTGGAAGKKNVSEAIAQLARLNVKEYLSSVRDRQGTQEINPRFEPTADVEWRLRKWENSDVAAGAQYTLSQVFLNSEKGRSMLWKDVDFNEFLMRRVTATPPVHLVTTLYKVSRAADAPNCSTKICPHIIDWLMEPEKVTEDWVCPDNEDDNVGCKFQHDCAGGLKCDVKGCVLFHPDEEARWVVLIDKKSVWAESMTFDEAGIYQPKGGERMKALDSTPECTNTEVWRASFPALAFGRTRISTSVTVATAASPATTQQIAPKTKDPALTTDAIDLGSTKQPLPPNGLDDEPASAVTGACDKKADAAAGEATAKEEKPTNAAAAAAAKLLTGPANKVAGATIAHGIQVEDQEETLDADSPPATASPSKQTKVADIAKAPTATTDGDEVATDAEKVPEQPEQGRRKRRRVDVLSAQGHQLIAQARAHLASGMSGKYQEILKRAAKLSPTERAALLTALANMIQQDQAKSLQLLGQSIAVAEHFTAENFTSKPSE